ncbi:MAG: VCBS repeat-containing protein [Bacteroidales bacterium]
MYRTIYSDLLEVNRAILTGFTDFNLNNSSTFSTINSGDINGNGYKDIIVVSNSQFWGVLYNDGLGNFSNRNIITFITSLSTDIDCGDLNDDGRDDIVICGQNQVYFSYPGNFKKSRLKLITLKME